MIDNRDLFTEEKIPKGFIAVQGEADSTTIDAITRYWTMAMSGVGGKFKIPVIPTGKEGTSMDFKTLSQSNRDMEYNKLMYFFLSLFAAVFGMDLAELGIKVDQSQSIIADSITGTRQETSKSRALKSLLSFQQEFMNKIIRKIDEEYEFMFVGIDPEDEQKKYDVALKAVTSTRTVNDMRKEDGLEALEGEENNTVLNPQLIQLKASLQMAEMQEQYGEEEFEENENSNQISKENKKPEKPEKKDDMQKSKSLEAHLESLLEKGYEVEIKL